MTCKDRTGRRLLIEDLLQIQDDGCRIPFAGLFLFAPNIPAMMLTDACTLLGQVNGATGTAVGVVSGPRSKWYVQFLLQKFSMLINTEPLLAVFFEIHDLYVMSTKPPACVLFKYDTPRFTRFDGLDYSITPIFPSENSIFWKGYSIRRRQVSLCPAFFLRIEMSGLLYRPGPRLLTEIKRLWELEKETLSRWGEIISGAQTFCRKR
jgi:hypothetical protein